MVPPTFSHPLAYTLVADDDQRNTVFSLTLAEAKQLHLAVLFAQAQLAEQPHTRQQLLALAARLDTLIGNEK